MTPELPPPDSRALPCCRWALVTALLGLCAISATIPGAGVRADAPPGQYTVTSGEVLDNLTGLVWEEPISPAMYTQAEAIAYCSGLGVGWRLPSLTELSSIVDETRFGPSIDPTAFPSTPSTMFWSSSSLAGAPPRGRVVHFGSGFSAAVPVVTDAYNARCVR